MYGIADGEWVYPPSFQFHWFDSRSLRDFAPKHVKKNAYVTKGAMLQHNHLALVYQGSRVQVHVEAKTCGCVSLIIKKRKKNAYVHSNSCQEHSLLPWITFFVLKRSSSFLLESSPWKEGFKSTIRIQKLTYKNGDLQSSNTEILPNRTNQINNSRLISAHSPTKNIILYYYIYYIIQETKEISSREKTPSTKFSSFYCNLTLPITSYVQPFTNDILFHLHFLPSHFFLFS